MSRGDHSAEKLALSATELQLVLASIAILKRFPFGKVSEYVRSLLPTQLKKHDHGELQSTYL